MRQHQPASGRTTEHAATPPRRRGRPAIHGIAAGRQVQSLARALALLEEVARIERGAALGDLATSAGLAPSTAHRLLKSLEAAHFVSHDGALGLWFVGVKAFNVGAAFLGARDVVALARPAMRTLMEESGESVNLAALEDGEVVFLAQVECRQMMRALSRPGGTAPLHASGVGKALLAALPEDEAARLIGAMKLLRYTANTLVTSDALAGDRAAARVRGHAIDDEEFTPGLRCVAAAIHDESSRPVAALSLSGPSARITDGRIAELGRLVRDQADRITQAIGGRAPDRR
ncbi:MAG: IclR family transcriptional regulator [Alphaproteobacteria bacterium]|nr:IclR family transcriptional regulator [Alphaproteobacteria bacterium]